MKHPLNNILFFYLGVVLYFLIIIPGDKNVVFQDLPRLLSVLLLLMLFCFPYLLIYIIAKFYKPANAILASAFLSFIFPIIIYFLFGTSYGFVLSIYGYKQLTPTSSFIVDQITNNKLDTEPKIVFWTHLIVGVVIFLLTLYLLSMVAKLWEKKVKEPSS